MWGQMVTSIETSVAKDELAIEPFLTTCGHIHVQFDHPDSNTRMRYVRHGKRLTIVINSHCTLYYRNSSPHLYGAMTQCAKIGSRAAEPIAYSPMECSRLPSIDHENF
jgi:hypothetical protein